MRHLTSIISPLFAIFLLSSCGEDKSPQMRQLLVGKWQHDYDMGDGLRVKGTTHYRDDSTVSTFSEKFRNGQKIDTRSSQGRWSVKGEYFRLEMTEGDRSKNRTQGEIARGYQGDLQV